MLSGIGSAEELARVSIPLVKDPPGVGAHFQGHVVLNILFRDKSKSALMLKPTSLFGKAAI